MAADIQASSSHPGHKAMLPGALVGILHPPNGTWHWALHPNAALIYSTASSAWTGLSCLRNLPFLSTSCTSAFCSVFHKILIPIKARGTQGAHKWAHTNLILPVNICLLFISHLLCASWVRNSVCLILYIHGLFHPKHKCTNCEVLEKVPLHTLAPHKGLRAL